jgi:hypothetical protein
MIRGTPADASALAVARPMPAVPPHSSAEVDSRLRGMVGKMIEAPLTPLLYPDNINENQISIDVNNI